MGQFWRFNQKCISDQYHGATLAQSAGIWVGDSVPLIETALCRQADHGAIIRHIDDGQITRAVMRDLDIRKLMHSLGFDKEDKTTSPIIRVCNNRGFANQ